jgi:hypothetical protein
VAGFSVANGLPRLDQFVIVVDSSVPFRNGHSEWDDIKDTDPIVRSNSYSCFHFFSGPRWPEFPAGILNREGDCNGGVARPSNVYATTTVGAPLLRFWQGRVPQTHAASALATGSGHPIAKREFTPSHIHAHDSRFAEKYKVQMM